ncbi:MAG TPA: TIGR02680 family protein, partial [Pseudonocardia sp.]|nr:TIGR02680 family protein [Pseudonocardia sp.]
EWNLLLGGDHPYPERLGYTWLEFGRIDEHGEPEFCTLGCGLKAVSGKGIARHWFFVSADRIGRDFALMDATGTALSRDRLIDTLGERGRVHDRARDYRRAVDERLFGLGEQRYGALVDLLIQLRQPQLSKRPSEQALSDALTQALPPLDQAVIADVAEAFRSLEDDRDTLTAMIEARDAATSFLTQYRRYARIFTRRRADRPRRAQGAYERVRTELGSAEAELATATHRLEAARAWRVELDAERGRLTTRDEVLRRGPEMRNARELELAAAESKRLGADAARAAGERELAAVDVARQGRRHGEATRVLAAATAEVDSARQVLTELAGSARVAAEHASRIDQPIDQDPDLAELRPDAARLADRQQRAIGHLRRLLTDADTAARTLAEARRLTASLDAEANDLATRRADADTAVRAHGTELAAAVRGHLERAVELRLPDPAATLAELELWAETLDGPNPAGSAVHAAGQAASTALAMADAELTGRERSSQAHRDELATEIERLDRGEHTAPPAPYTRDTASRTDRPGAPLWQLIDFATGVSEPDRAGIEAALEASGVLDAWVTPAGELLGAELDDVVLRPGQPAPRNLTSVLWPSVDRGDPRAAAVSDETLTDLLSSIGLGAQDHGAWIGTDGQFRIGPLDGAWHKPAAGYIGRGAREAARRARLAELLAELSEVDAALAELAEARQRLAERMATLTDELATLPGDAALRQAHAQVNTLVEEVTRFAAKRERAQTAVVAATAAGEGARAALAEGARDADLPAEPAELSEVADALADYRVALAGLWPAITARRSASAHARDAAEDLARADTALTERAERTERSAHEAAAAEVRYQTLHSTVGAAVAELQKQLAEVATLLDTNESAHAAAERASEEAIAARGRAEGRREQLAERLDIATAERAEATEEFRRFAGTGLLSVALPELEVPDPAVAWAPDPTVRLARRVNEELAEVSDDDGVWERAQHRVNAELKTLHDTLSRHGNRAEADLRDEGVVVEVEFQGRRTSVPGLAEALTAEVADRERLLSEREREILENHLVNEVASTLQELISSAEAQVAAMNAELETRPTSTGMQLRLLWRPKEDGPAGLAAARERLLRQTADAWAEEDRAAVGEFLQSEIAGVRTKDPAGTWLEHLTEALDYRSWNRFVIQRRQNGQWRPAAGPASGGERVLAASVPLFAAASSHYASAGNPHAPRLVTLDEAFAGVDDNARAKYLGLLAAFDLDVVMTSEREWGCYPEVPGLAISQLSRTDGVAAVLVTNWEWDGARRVHVDRPVRALRTEAEPAATPTPQPTTAAPQGGLWE